MPKLPKGIRIQAAAAGKATRIDVRGYIGTKVDKNWNLVNTEDAVRDALPAKSDEPVDLYVHSKGGDFYTALGIYNALFKRKNVTGYNAGFALSSGSVILSAAGKIICPKASVTMIHCASALPYDAENADQKRQSAQMLDTMDKAMAAAYAKKMGMDEKSVLKLMKVTTWWDGSQALEMGFSDENGEEIALPDDDDDGDEDEEEERASAEMAIVAHYVNIPENLRSRLVQASAVSKQTKNAGDTPAEDKDQMREQIIAALAAEGITLPKDATDEQVLSAWNKFQTDQKQKIKSLGDANSKHLDAQKKRVETRVQAAVDSKRIKAERKDTWVARGLADESCLDELDDIPAPQAATPPAAQKPQRGAPTLPPPHGEDQPDQADEKINANLDRILALQREAKRLPQGDPRKAQIAKEIGKITAELGKLRNEVMDHKVTYSPLSPVQR